MSEKSKSKLHLYVQQTDGMKMTRESESESSSKSFIAVTSSNWTWLWVELVNKINYKPSMRLTASSHVKIECSRSLRTPSTAIAQDPC